MIDGVAVKSLPLLLIEDERSVMDFIRIALERNGYSCATASSGVEGLKLLQAGEFGGIIFDMRTPGGGRGARVFAWIVPHKPDLEKKKLFFTAQQGDEKTKKA